MLNLDVKQSHIHTEVLHNIKHESSVLQLDIEKSHILTYVLRTIKYKRCVVHLEMIQSLTFTHNCYILSNISVM